MEPVEFGSTNGTEAESSEEIPEEYSLASPFLNGMPEEHRTLLSPYVKQWDGQVTKKFQDYSKRLKPYEALGPPDELQKYYNFAQNFRNDPEGLFRLMWNGLHETYGDTFQDELLRILELQEQEMAEELEYEEEETPAPAVDDQFQQNVMKELNELREWKTNFEKQQEDQVGQQQLDGILDQMHNAFGDFNDDFIVMELSKHGDVQQAMKSWNDLIGKYSSQQAPARQAPRIMGGQGGVPSGQVDTDKLRGADRKQAVANMLAQLEG